LSALDQLARAIDPKAKRAGNGSWSCRCPAHEDKHASLSLSMKDGRLLWRCHSGCSQADVQVQLHKRGLLGKVNGADHTTAKVDQSDDWRPIAPVPSGTAEPGFTHAEYGKPSRTWTYRDAGGRVLFHVARFNPPGERKQIIPRCWGTLKGKIGWHWRHPATPRPLYRLDELVTRPADPVLIVEGEKAADAAAEILPGYVVTTWPGGSNTAGMADWSALKGRCIMIWPDHDEPGRKVAAQIGDALLAIAAGVWIVDPPADLPEGWDLADDAPDGLDIRALLDQAERHVDRLERLVEEAGADPGAPFESGSLDFLAALRARDPAAYERTRARLKKAHVRVAALDQEVERNRRSNGRAHQSGQENQGDSFDLDLDLAQVERSRARSRSDSVLELVADAVEQLGAAGVRREAKILYLAITTRLLSHPFRPAHVLVKGASAGGKNYLVDVVAQLMPESAVYKMTGMSDRALAYLVEPMAHRFIILAEAAAIEDSEVALALVRSLLSEGEIRYPTVEKDENGKLATTLKHLEGPTGLIMTTTAPRIHTENETRHLSLNIRDDWDQTQTILHEQAKLAAGKDVDGLDLDPWHDFQRWLEGQERRVVVPFADRIAALINAGPVRIRRDFPRFLALIMAHAILHQENRGRDAEGRIVATLQDYEVVYDLVARDFAETAEMSHPTSIVQVVEAVRELQITRPDGVTIHVLIDHAKANVWGSTDATC
jgi:hypothetical protein